MRRPQKKIDNYTTSAWLRSLAELLSREDVVELSASWIRRLYDSETHDPLIGGFVSTFPLVTTLPIREQDVRHADVREIEGALVRLLKRRQKLGLDGPRFSRYLSVLLNHHENSRSALGGRMYRTHSQTAVSLAYIATAGIGGMTMTECLGDMARRVNLSATGIRVQLP